MELRKPLFLHCRDAADAFARILARHELSAPAVVHCFTGSARELTQFVGMGLHVGITGWVRPVCCTLCSVRAVHRGGACIARWLCRHPCWQAVALHLSVCSAQTIRVCAVLIQKALRHGYLLELPCPVAEQMDRLRNLGAQVCDDRPERGGAELASLLHLIPADKLMLETDAPYLVPRTIKPAKQRPRR